jgi:glyoxylase I family protein
MQVVRTAGPPGNARFLADATGRTLLEIYHNPAAPLPDYPSTHPLVLHLAFAVDDVAAERERLLAAGATAVDEIAATTAGDTMTMLRDPWGLPLQILRRHEPMP